MIHTQRCEDTKKNGKEESRMLEAINLYAMVVEAAIPFAVTFALGNLIVTSFLKMAFKGKVEF